jgi:predicted ribosome quality control (RQC) complex YloA/Tae2 family protein
VPTSLQKMLMQAYGGLSSALVKTLLAAADLHPHQPANALSQADWDRLFAVWQVWLTRLDQGQFDPGWTETGYTVLGWGMTTPVDNLHDLLRDYYTHELNHQQFDRFEKSAPTKAEGALG